MEQPHGAGLERMTRTARLNLRKLGDNTYPGRGIVTGVSAGGKRLIQVYWIMGRSENSRNRIFVPDGVTLRTEAADPARMSDPSLVIYTAMRELPGHYLVTNGDHTDTLWEGISAGRTFPQALSTRVHEPDDPNWTPRIAGVIDLTAENHMVWLAIIKAHPFDPGTSIRQFHQYEKLQPGFGWCITTYQGDGAPLPSFVGEPYLLPLDGGPAEILASVWDHLNRDNRVAIALKCIDPQSGKSAIRVLNRFQPAQRGAGNE